jgi:hypothetical protein
MPKFTFYSQTRYDGGVRCGIGAEGYTDLQHFQPGDKETDPALLWYIDVVCEGEMLPNDPEAFRSWLLENKDYFAQHLADVADDLAIGFDKDLAPFHVQFSDGPDGVGVELTISAIRRLVARDIADKLRVFARTWENALRELAPLATA